MQGIIYCNFHCLHAVQCNSAKIPYIITCISPDVRKVNCFYLSREGRFVLDFVKQPGNILQLPQIYKAKVAKEILCQLRHWADNEK